MSEVQKRLGDAYHPTLEDLTEDDWQELYERHDGCLADVNRAVGPKISLNQVRRVLRQAGIHEPAEHKRKAWDFHSKLPHQVGLSPLDCGGCGAEEIMDHPCPECGFDPRGGGDD